MLETGSQLNVILNLPRVGGTLFSRILSISDEVRLLSEVHPSRDGEDIARQLQSNYSIVPDKPFESWMDAVHFCMRFDAKTTILRDHTHRDFTMPDGNTFELSTVKSVADLSPNVIALTRNPVDQYLSCMSRTGMARYFTLPNFVNAWIQYNRRIREYTVIRYEDLVDDPVKEIKRACDVFDITYNDKLISHFSSIHTISGDRDQPSRAYGESQVVKLPPRQGHDEVLSSLSGNIELARMMSDLGYSLE